MSMHPYTRLFAMSSDPTTGDDSGDGYEVGDVWVTTTKSWQCLDNSLGAAIWIDLTAAGSSSGHTIQEEGTPLTDRANLNFVGTNVTVTDDAGNDATVVTFIADGHVIQEEGTPLTARANLNFVGASVTATDDAGNDATVITITGGSGGHTIQDEGTPLTARTNLNFTGGGVTVTDDAGNDATDIDIPASLTTEEVEDIVAGMMVESGGIGISYDDVAGELLFDVETPSNAAYAKIDGWETPAGSQSYSSADSPIFVISFAADMTGTIYPGVRIKLTQTTVKYFIVVAVGAYSGGVTLVTVYGGIDYTLANAAIASLQYSYMKCPRGFPAGADKWTTIYTDTTNLNVGGPANNTYYNPGGAAYAFPLGKWKLYYNWTATLTVTTTAVRTLGLVSALSTATGSVSDMELRMSQQVMGPIGACGIILIATRSKILSLASKTTYYPIVLGSVATDAITTVGIRGDLNTTVISLECAYL